jgi:hypothetical protein
MIPNITIITDQITDITYPDRTYKIVFAENNLKNSGIVTLNLTLNPSESDRISGYTEGLDAVAQAVYLMLSVERYKFVIYSWDYGVELVDLFGQPMPYVMSELPRRITEALTMDDRIDDVTDFDFVINGKRLHTTFTVVTNMGNISAEMEVAV